MSEWWISIPITLLGGCLTLLASSSAPPSEPAVLKESRAGTGCAAVCAKHVECGLDDTGCLTKCEHSVVDPAACGECWTRESCISVLAATCYSICYEVR